MKVILLLALLSTTLAQEIEDLGIVSRRRSIILERCTNRTDFVKFVIEIQPAGSSNTVTLIRTNDFLSLADFGAVPAGKLTMGVHSVCADGEESPVALYRLEVKRSAPTSPRARSITVAATNAPPTLINALEHHRRARTNHVEHPPLPGGMALPMMDGTNKTYNDHMREQQNAYFARGTRK